MNAEKNTRHRDALGFLNRSGIEFYPGWQAKKLIQIHNFKLIFPPLTFILGASFLCYYLYLK